MDLYLVIILFSSLIYIFIRFIYPRYFQRIDIKNIEGFIEYLDYKLNGQNFPLILRLGISGRMAPQKWAEIVTRRILILMGHKDVSVAIKFVNLDLRTSGRIHTLDYFHFDVELSNAVKDNYTYIVSILVHELTHLYMNRNMLYRDGVEMTHTNEVLTEVASIYLGFGTQVLNSIVDEEIVIPGLYYESKKHFFGYIKPEQFGYIFAKFLFERGILIKNLDKYLSPGAMRHLKIGHHYLLRNRGRDTFNYKEGLAIIPCSNCEKFLRFPANDRKLQLRCKNCNNIMGICI